ncbi:hypothetical protein NDU88_004083 [Pleurodeles waltl]|uniref:Uncharacterized protein n=1 Tax=Pleurodeles waltl TaxID=8319 RepID=A0AAV7T770_PLEWA|nr:hypothetical protein NDU88_004083 [Pleurodeles waltl]
MAQVRLDFWQPGTAGLQAGCDSFPALGVSEEQASLLRLRQWAERQRTLMGVGAPSVHRPEVMVRSRATHLTSRASIGAAVYVLQKKVINKELSTSRRADSFLHIYRLEEEVLDYDEGDEVEEEEDGEDSQRDGKGGREERTMIMAHIPRGERRGNLVEGGEVTQCVSVAGGNSPFVKRNLGLRSQGKDMGIQAEVESDEKVGSDVMKSDVLDTTKGSAKSVSEPGSQTQAKAAKSDSKGAGGSVKDTKLPYMEVSEVQANEGSTEEEWS